MKCFFMLFFFAALASLTGCSAKVTPDCSKQPELGTLATAEKAALADALSRYGNRCERKDYQCDISLVRNSRNEILLTIASVYPHRGSGQCLQAPGDQDLLVYNPDGAFVERVMSL